MKLLVISHNPVSRHNAMGKTLASLLADFPPEEVCQLYIYPAYPCQGVCGSFYRITDLEVLESFLLMGLPGGTVEERHIGGDTPGFGTRKEVLLYGSAKNKRPLRRLLRDILWSCGTWDNGKLRSWMEREKPDCIFAAGGDGLFLYQIALTLSRRYAIPMVGYICDEYYFLSPEKDWISRLRQRLLKGKMEDFLARSSHLVVISRELERAYGSRFALPVTVIMTGSSRDIAAQVKCAGPIKRLTYLGNVTYGRCHALAAIGRALDKMGSSAVLEIYSAQPDPAMDRCFAGINSLVFRGFVQGAELENVWAQAQLMVHVEDFSPRNVELVRHSISTKIPDCLASGIPLLAYGPEKTASMAYLMEMDCAFTAVEEGQLERVLYHALHCEEERRNKAQNGLAVAQRNHQAKVNSVQLKSLLRQVVEGAS